MWLQCCCLGSRSCYTRYSVCLLYWYKITNTDAAMLLSWLPLLLCKALARDDERKKEKDKKNTAAAAAATCSALAPDAAGVELVGTRRKLPLEKVSFFYLRRWRAGVFFVFGRGD